MNANEENVKIDIESGGFNIKSIVKDESESYSSYKIPMIKDEFFNYSRGLEFKEEYSRYKSIWEIKDMMNGKFGFHEGEISCALDILSIYLKGQKRIYLEAKSYCEFYLHRLMMPCILLSSVCSVISGVFNEVPLAGKIIAGGTALNAFLMSVISYYKLDARAEAHKMTAYSFDQLISECEFNSGKILLYHTNKNKKSAEENKKIKQSNKSNKSNESKESNQYNIYDKSEFDNEDMYDIEYLNNFINDIEKKVREIKEKNQFIIPDVIRKRYGKICELNIFTEIKKYQIDELLLLNDLKVAYNDSLDFENKIIKAKKENKDVDVNDYKLYRQSYLIKEEHFKKVIANRKEILNFDEKFKILDEPEKCCQLFY